jgi:alkylhydroperoxidase/carboxymuconolactone decarboxylase family protein YurZ
MTSGSRSCGNRSSGATPVTDRTDEAAPEPEGDLAGEYRRLAAERGYHFATFEWLSRHDPDFERARLETVKMTYTRPDGALPVKYRELIASAVLAYRCYPSLKLHLARAMREGATLQEVIQALEVASVPGGQATLHFGIDQLIELEQEQPELFPPR